MKKKYRIFLLLIILLVFTCKEKKTEETQEFQEICKKVAQCDNQFKNFSDIEKHCLSFFIKLKNNKSEALNPIIQCIKNAPCDSLSFQSCTIEYMKELQNMKPATK
jgi:hypothetical protein